MSIADHVAILTYSSLTQALKNKLSGRVEYFALLAFPPSAGADIYQLFVERTNGAPITNFALGVEPNSKQKKPIPGIPDDWLIVRAASQYAPYLAGTDGVQLDQTDVSTHNQIRQLFYAGAKVRPSLSAWAWTFSGKHGMSLNLLGLMDAGEAGERLNIGNSAGSDFARFAQQGGQQTAPAATGNPFAAAQNVPSQAEQAQAAGSGNPFAQKPQAASNPFV